MDNWNGTTKLFVNDNDTMNVINTCTSMGTMLKNRLLIL